MDCTTHPMPSGGPGPRFTVLLLISILAKLKLLDTITNRFEKSAGCDVSPPDC